MRRKLIIGWFIVCIIGVCAVLLTEDIYSLAKNWLQSDARGGSFVREIGTNFDLWRNGYLGIFFRFKMFGWLNWLAVPLFTYFLITIKKRKRWEIALGLSLCLASIFICLQGYQNFRYQLTLFPVLTPIIFLFGWKILKEKNKKIIGGVVLVCCLMLLGNLYFSKDSYQYYFNSGIGHGRPGERFPYKLIQYINEEVDENSVIRELNQPLLYYHTNKNSKIKGEVKDRYVLSRNSRLAGHDLVIEDQGYRLYKKKTASEQLTPASFADRVPDFELNLSSWSGVDEIPMAELSKVLPPMKVLGVRNVFFFKHIFSESGHAIRVMLTEADFNTKPVLQFGYINIRKALGLEIKDGETLYLVARMRKSSPGRKRLQLFIQDKTDYWVREEVNYTGHVWKDMLIGKRIRDGAKNICIGVAWKPESVDEWIEIQSIRMYIEKNESLIGQ